MMGAWHTVGGRGGPLLQWVPLVAPSEQAGLGDGTKAFFGSSFPCLCRPALLKAWECRKAGKLDIDPIVLNTRNPG